MNWGIEHVDRASQNSPENAKGSLFSVVKALESNERLFYNGTITKQNAYSSARSVRLINRLGTLVVAKVGFKPGTFGWKCIALPSHLKDYSKILHELSDRYIWNCRSIFKPTLHFVDKSRPIWKKIMFQLLICRFWTRQTQFKLRVPREISLLATQRSSTTFLQSVNFILCHRTPQMEGPVRLLKEQKQSADDQQLNTVLQYLITQINRITCYSFQTKKFSDLLKRPDIISTTFWKTLFQQSFKIWFVSSISNIPCYRFNQNKTAGA